MKKLKLFLMLVMLGFGMIAAQTVESASPVTKAPCEGRSNTSLDIPFIDGSNCGIGPQWNSRIAIAPYAQVVADNSYTFIGISHPSLATAHTSIGVVVEALNMVTVPNTKSGRAAVFTVSAGETHRVFIVNQTHPTINLNNSAFTDTQTHLITTTDAAQFGNIKAWSIGTEPSHATNAHYRVGKYASDNAHHSFLYRHDNLNQLAMWGVVYQTANGAGFALEFVGDMHDSVHLFNDAKTGVIAKFSNQATGQGSVEANSSGSGRGVN